MADSDFSNDKKEPLKYFICSKAAWVVVSLIGEIEQSSDQVIEKMKRELPPVDERAYYVLNFNEVNKVGLTGMPIFGQLQKYLRERGAALRICYLQPEVKKVLLERGVVRKEEIVDELVQALKSFKR